MFQIWIEIHFPFPLLGADRTHRDWAGCLHSDRSWCIYLYHQFSWLLRSYQGIACTFNCLRSFYYNHRIASNRCHRLGHPLQIRCRRPNSEIFLAHDTKILHPQISTGCRYPLMGLHDGRGKYTLFQKCWDPYGDEFTTGHVLKLLSPNIGASICCLFEICLEFTKLVFFLLLLFRRKRKEY